MPAVVGETPQAAKAWTFLPNLNVGSYNPKALFLLCKNGLVSPLAWAVIGSSDSAAAALDGVDRLTTTANVVNHDSGAHSWIVLEQPTTGLQVVFDFNYFDAHHLTAAMSPAGAFTGGSTTARPTAADELVMLDQDVWGNSNASTYHLLQSADGENTVLIGGPAGTSQCQALWVFGRAASLNVPLSTWDRLVGYMYGGNDNGYSLVTSSTARFKARIAAGAMPMTAITRSASMAALDFMAQQQTGLHPGGQGPFWPIGLWSWTSGRRGHHGHIIDLWLGASSLAGSTYQGQTFRQFGSIIVPWDGSTVPV